MILDIVIWNFNLPDPDSFLVIDMNKSLITEKREYPRSQILVRNSSFFKLFRYEEEEDGAQDQLEDNNHVDDSQEITEQTTNHPIDEERSEAIGQTESNTQPDPKSSSVKNDPKKLDIAKRGRGRPNKEEAQAMKEQRLAKEIAEITVPDATRKSRRLANLPPV